ncbi:MAG: hypothetical protein QOJ64_3553 [Acidobacteriota bacterium]|nr:hypothetical protein [Acidobacteriota bacterium]
MLFGKAFKSGRDEARLFGRGQYRNAVASGPAGDLALKWQRARNQMRLSLPNVHPTLPRYGTDLTNTLNELESERRLSGRFLRSIFLFRPNSTVSPRLFDDLLRDLPRDRIVMRELHVIRAARCCD